MDSLLDNLRLLNYQKEFLAEYKFSPLNKTYFVLQDKNPNEQFFIFACLCFWLVKICGGDLDKPQQFDDPNATVSNILAAAKSLQINFDNGPNKIKQGNGEFVVQLLTMLSERALQIKKFVFQKPSHKTEDFAEEAEVDHEAEVTTENVEEHLFLNQEDDDEDMYVAEIKKKNEERPLTSIMPSVDSSDWKLEVERVSPLLKVQIQNDNKDWRIHLEQISFHYSKISNLFVSTSENLKLLHKEVEKTLEKINSREKYINSQFETQTEEFRVLQEQLSMLKQKHSVSNSNVTDLTTELSRISEELDSVKSRMDDIGNGMTDSKPLVNIKQGVSRLKNEVKQMDLRIGVIQHTLLNAKMKNKGTLNVPNFSTAQIFAIHVL